MRDGIRMAKCRWNLASWFRISCSSRTSQTKIPRIFRSNMIPAGKSLAAAMTQPPRSRHTSYENTSLLLTDSFGDNLTRSYLKFYIILALCFAFSFHLYATDISDQYSQFKSFLSKSRPPIKFVEISRSANLYMLNGVPYNSNVIYKASLQPKTYYIREIGNLFNSHTQTSLTAGMNQENYWFINDHNQVAVANRRADIAGTNTPPKQFNSEMDDVVKDVLNLGIENLDLPTMSWTGTSFTANSIAGSWGSIKGQITYGDGVSPESIVYKFSLKPERVFYVNYQYVNTTKRPKWMPHTIVTYLTSPKFKSKPITNVIEQLDLGYAEIGAQGYRYQDFYTNMIGITNANLIVYSNGVGNIEVGTNFVAIQEAAATIPLFDLQNIWKARFIFMAILSASLFGIGWFIVRAYLQNKKINNENNQK